MKKVILITGASSGIGKASVQYFAQKDWGVIATMRAPEKEKDLTGLKDVLVTRLDVQDADSIQLALEAGIARFGKIDAVVNNAGFSLYGVFESIPRQKIQEQFDVNVFGVMAVINAILPHFRKNKSGMILNVSSRGGVIALPLLSLYCATKFALEGFSESLAFELASQNITVKVVAPGGGANTNFSQRMTAEQAHTISIADYDAFTAKVAEANASFARQRVGFTTSLEDIAKVIYEAATDGTDRFRYETGHDIPPFLKAKREMSDQDYIHYMRSHFSPKP